MAIKEETNASAKLGKEKALELAAAASKVIVAKGKKVTVFDLKQDPPDEATLLKHMLGATGNLRAPTVKRGKTLLVGFNAERYQDAFG